MEFLCTTKVTREDKLSNLNFITSLKELNKFITDNKSHNRFILRKDFIDIYFPYNQLYDYKKNISFINPNAIIETEGYKIQTDIDEDNLKLLSNNLNKDDLIMLLQFKYHDILEVLFKLINNYNENKNDNIEGASIISSLRESVDRLNLENENLKSKLDKEIINNKDLENKLSVLVKRINYTHNIGLDENYLFRSNKNSYDKIIYIKEITRVQFTDTLVEALQEILRLMYNMPTRLLVIEGYYADGKVSLYPTLKPHYKLSERDVLSGDILMLGYQPKLFKDLMRNPSNISILIILDRGGYEVPHLISDNVEYLFTASCMEDVPNDIPMSRVISYNNDTLYIPFIKDFDKLSKSEKIHRYSSLKIIKQIISLIE